MKTYIWHWWPLLPACLVLYLGGASFVELYPSTAPKTVNRYSSQAGPDSLLAFLNKVHGLKSANHSMTSLVKDSEAPWDSVPLIDSVARSDSGRADSSVKAIKPKRVSPFRPVHGPNFSNDRALVGPKADPPWRKFILKGTVGNTVATISDRFGKKVIVKVGENVDSATVISIEPNKVVLKDRAGKFDLLQEP